MSVLPMSQRVPDDGRESRVNKVSQLPLFGDVPVDHVGRWERLRNKLAASVDRVGNKRMAGEVDEKASVISNALAGRDRHYFRAEWVLWLIENDADLDVLAYLAAVRGCELVPAEALSPEVELERRKAAEVELYGPEGAALINRKVFGR